MKSREFLPGFTVKTNSLYHTARVGRADVDSAKESLPTPFLCGGRRKGFLVPGFLVNLGIPSRVERKVIGLRRLHPASEVPGSLLGMNRNPRALLFPSSVLFIEFDLN